MNFKKSQSGRSMVEMLGVLAIIGVLSVGGIAGYSLSMRRHRANGIVDYLSKYALLYYSKCQKHLLEGDITDISNCANDYGLSYQNAGIGDLPTGVHSFAAHINSSPTTGIDTVHVLVGIKDTKLCQAVASVVGSECESSAVAFTIKQN